MAGTSMWDLVEDGERSAHFVLNLPEHVARDMTGRHT